MGQWSPEPLAAAAVPPGADIVHEDDDSRLLELMRAQVSNRWCYLQICRQSFRIRLLHSPGADSVHKDNDGCWSCAPSWVICESTLFFSHPPRSVHVGIFQEAENGEIADALTDYVDVQCSDDLHTSMRIWFLLQVKQKEAQRYRLAASAATGGAGTSNEGDRLYQQMLTDPGCAFFSQISLLPDFL